MSSVCNQDCLECVSLEERQARKFKLGFAVVFSIIGYKLSKNLKQASNKASYIVSDRNKVIAGN